METRATLPQLLAACSLIDRYTYDPEETFSAPITAFHGVDDWVASEETKLWEGLTTCPFLLHTMPATSSSSTRTSPRTACWPSSGRNC